jgi:hypothetical protein
MCVVTAKYFKDTGWLIGKNRDRAYKTEVVIKQSLRGGLERLLLWDKETKWTEGVNEFGVAIVSSALLVDKDEKMLNQVQQQREANGDSTGANIRKCLLEKTVKDALNKAVELEITGNTLITDGETLYLLEGTLDDEALQAGVEKFIYKYKKISKDDTIARSNHGFYIKSGYELLKDRDDNMARAWESSKARQERVAADIKKIDDPDDFLDALSYSGNKDWMLNPLRISKTHGSKTLVTTGQILINAKDRTLHYRPVWCKIDLKTYENVNTIKTKTFYEIISARKLLSLKESINNIIKKGNYEMKEFDTVIETILEGNYIPEVDTQFNEEDEVTDKKSLTDYAMNLGKEAFGDDVDEKKIKDMVDNAIENADDDGDTDWGAAVGIIQQSITGG